MAYAKHNFGISLNHIYKQSEFKLTIICLMFQNGGHHAILMLNRMFRHKKCYFVKPVYTQTLIWSYNHYRIDIFVYLF